MKDFKGMNMSGSATARSTKSIKTDLDNSISKDLSKVPETVE